MSALELTPLGIPPCTTPCPPAVLPGVPHILQLVVPHVGHGEDEDVLVGVHTAPQLRGSRYRDRDGHGHGGMGRRGKGERGPGPGQTHLGDQRLLGFQPLAGRPRQGHCGERRERQGGTGTGMGNSTGKRTAIGKRMRDGQGVEGWGRGWG